MERRKLETVLTAAEFTNSTIKLFDKNIKYYTRLDRDATIRYLHMDPSIMKFIHEDMIPSKGAYVSPLVA